MATREQNLKILQLAHEGKLTKEDLKFADDISVNGEPGFNITMHLSGPQKEPTPEEKERIDYLKSQGKYFDVTLNLSV